MATESDLVRRVLQELYVLSGTEIPSAEDDALVRDAIQEAHAELLERRIAYWALSDIPESVMRGLTLIVAGNAGRKLVPEMTVGECEQMRETGMRRIREVIALQADHDPVPQTYF